MRPKEFRVCFFSSIMHLSCRLQGAEVTTLEAEGGRGDQGNKGASLNLAVVLSGKLAVGCSHMGAGPSPVLWFSQWEYKGSQGFWCNEWMFICVT